MANPSPTAFITTLEATLDHFNDPAWLGEHSPFAAPYFLHQRLPAAAILPAERGAILRQLLLELCAQIAGKNAEQYRQLLQLYYVDGLAPGKILERLAIGRTKLSEDRRQAIALLAEQLIQFSHPALRLEKAPKVELFLARNQEQERCVRLLREQQTVALVGAGGIGKTSLAAKIAHELEQGWQIPCFWYTIRLDLNDQVESFVFALGLFAKQLGVPSLWLELLATHGKAATELKREKLLEMVRFVLEKLPRSPLLCIDEIDLLSSAAEPSDFVSLIESLRSLTPILLIGQRATLLYDHVEPLIGLAETDFADLLDQQSLAISPRQRQQLYQITQGNPRLTLLFCATVKAGDVVTDLLAALLNAPLLTTLFARMLQRLSPNELSLLLQISVFRTLAPLQHWQYEATSAALTALLAKQLLQVDAQGGVEVQLVYRPLLLQNLNQQQAQELHQQAAHVCSQSGAYTETAYHLLQAGQPTQGFLVWHEHKQWEIDQGQAAAALRLLRTLPAESLSPDVRQAWQLTCGDLEFLTGHPLRAFEDIRTLLDQASLLGSNANELAGRIYNDQGEFEKAAARFQETIKFADSFVDLKAIHARKGLAWGYLRQRQEFIDAAEVELNRAAYEIENMRGNLADDREEFAQAEIHYRNALLQAESLQFVEGIAKTCNNLANVLRMQGKFSVCIALLERAFRSYEQLGKLAAMAGCRMSLAVVHNLDQQFAAALEVVAEAEELLASRDLLAGWRQAICHDVCAEAYLGLSMLDLAKEYAQKVVDSEEIDLQPDGYRIFGEALAQLGDVVNGVYSVQRSIALVEADSNRYLAAFGWRSLGKIYTIQASKDRAIESYQKAVELFESLNLQYEVEKVFALIRSIQ